MVIVEITGGLGNQMFQYALARKLKDIGKEVRLDISYYTSKNSIRDFQLDIFDVPYKAASRDEILRYRGYVADGNLIDRVKQMRYRNQKKIYIEDLFRGYQPEIYNYDDVYLSGYWQNEQYFKDIRKEILCAYRFPGEAVENNSALVNEIHKSNSVSMHIRRGDYLDVANSWLYKDICTPAYYENAMNYLKQKTKNPQFYVFTDDPEWAREQFAGREDMKVIEAGKGKKDYYDMYLMSRCRHHILANSSFSWWGAWLNESEQKMVLSPKQWLNGHEISNAICEDFIRIEG